MGAVVEIDAAGDFIGQILGGGNAGVGFAGLGAVGGVLHVIGRGGVKFSLKKLHAFRAGEGDVAAEVDLRALDGGGALHGEGVGGFLHVDGEGVHFHAGVREVELELLRDGLRGTTLADVAGELLDDDVPHLNLARSTGSTGAGRIKRAVAAGCEEGGSREGSETKGGGGGAHEGTIAGLTRKGEGGGEKTLNQQRARCIHTARHTPYFLEKTVMTDFITLEGVKPDEFHLRHGVGMLFFNRDKELLVGLRAGTDQWQLPQGGRDYADPAMMQDDAAREMWQELGIKPHEVLYAGTLPDTTFYMLPKHMRGGRGFDAQQHHWLVYHYTPAGTPDIRTAEDHEFDDVAWKDFDWLLAKTSPFRAKVYLQVKAMYQAMQLTSV